MLYLLWSLLNIALFLFFVVICFKTTKLVRESFGLVSFLIFVLGLLSFIGNSNNNKANKEPHSNQIRSWKFTSEDSLDRNETFYITIELEENLISKYNLGIKFGKNKQSKLNFPISAYSQTTGFISGINWYPLSIIINKTYDNTKFEYYVDGIW